MELINVSRSALYRREWFILVFVSLTFSFAFNKLAEIHKASFVNPENEVDAILLHRSSEEFSLSSKCKSDLEKKQSFCHVD